MKSKVYADARRTYFVRTCVATTVSEARKRALVV